MLKLSNDMISKHSTYKPFNLHYDSFVNAQPQNNLFQHPFAFCPNLNSEWQKLATALAAYNFQS